MIEGSIEQETPWVVTRYVNPSGTKIDLGERSHDLTRFQLKCNEKVVFVDD